MIYYTPITLLIVWTHVHLCTLASVQGNRFSNNNGSLIFIDDESFYYDDVKDKYEFIFRNSNIVNEYYKHCGSNYSIN